MPNEREERSIAMNRVCGCVAGLLFVTAIWAIVVSCLHFLEWASLDRTHNNLKWVGMALHQYHDSYGCFPPHVVYDDNGKAMHSWRALILQQMNETISAPTHESAYRFDEPWDSQRNRAAAEKFAGVLGEYSVFAVVGEEAAWSTDGCRRMSDFSDGLSNTILVLAIKDIAVGWHEPCDLTFDGEDLWLDHGGNKRRIDLSASKLFVLFGDGTVQYFSEGITEDVAGPLFTRAADDGSPD